MPYADPQDKQRWYQENKDRYNEVRQQWRLRNKETEAEKRRRYERNRYKTDAQYRHERRSKSLLESVGITLDQKLEMMAQQENKCDICRAHLSDTFRAHADHCHATGVVRGILCHPCNTRLGWFEDKRTAIIEYLDKFR